MRRSLFDPAAWNKNRSVNAVKRHVLPVVESAGVLKIAKRAYSARKTDTVPQIQIQGLPFKRHPEFAGDRNNVAVAFQGFNR